jgi:two-component system OmpR family sensor kinase
MRWGRWLAILAPALVGLGLNLLLFFSPLPNPILVLRFDLAALAFLAGLLLSLLAGGGLAFWEWVERQRLANALQSAEDRRQFLQRLDHELKNPLTAILVGLANLGDTGPDAPARETVASIQAQAQRLRRLVADLRKLADLETRALERTPVNIGVLLEEVFDLAQDNPVAEERTLNLSIPHAPWPLPNISGDRDLLFLAVHNLLDNALKFTHPGDTLEIRAFEDNAHVTIEVADTGPGIPAGEIDHVWEELYRGEEARGIAGSGLGLALVRAIVARHGGETGLRSRPGQGTVITLRLPVAESSR